MFDRETKTIRLRPQVSAGSVKQKNSCGSGTNQMGKLTKLISRSSIMPHLSAYRCFYTQHRTATASPCAFLSYQTYRRKRTNSTDNRQKSILLLESTLDIPTNTH